MLKAVRNQFGTFGYESTPLEDFVDELAREWQVPLSDLSPAQSPSFGLFLERIGGRKSDKDDVRIRYTRNPSVEFHQKALERRKSPNYVGENASDLYADTEPHSQYAYLTRAGRRVVLEFLQDGKKNVKVYVADIANALSATMRERPVHDLEHERAWVILDFNGTAHSENVIVPDPLGDMQNSFTFAKHYFGR